MWESALDEINEVPRKKSGKEPTSSLGIIDSQSFRRLSKDYEIRVRSAENMVRIGMLRLTVAKCV